MNSSFRFRVSVSAAITLLLMISLLIGRVSADSGSPGCSREVHQTSEGSMQLSDLRVMPPTPQHMRFRRAGPPEILSAFSRPEDRLSQPHSDDYESLAHAAEDNAADSESYSRRLLRDISPPGMWPPGSYDDESLPSMSRRRFLAATGSDRKNNLNADLAHRLAPSVESLLRISGRDIRRLSDSLTSQSQPSFRTDGVSFHPSSNSRR